VTAWLVDTARLITRVPHTRRLPRHRVRRQSWCAARRYISAMAPTPDVRACRVPDRRRRGRSARHRGSPVRHQRWPVFHGTRPALRPGSARGRRGTPG